MSKVIIGSVTAPYVHIGDADCALSIFSDVSDVIDVSTDILKVTSEQILFCLLNTCSNLNLTY